MFFNHFKAGKKSSKLLTCCRNMKIVDFKLEYGPKYALLLVNLHITFGIIKLHSMKPKYLLMNLCIRVGINTGKDLRYLPFSRKYFELHSKNMFGYLFSSSVHKRGQLFQQCIPQ